MIKIIRVTNFCDVPKDQVGFDVLLESFIEDIQNKRGIIKDIKYSINVPYDGEEMRDLKAGEVNSFVIHSALIIYEDRVEEMKKMHELGIDPE